MSGSDIEDRYKNWVYRFRVEDPVNRDAKILVAIRERCVEVDGQMEWQHEVLTTEGWTPYAEYESWDYDVMPTMTGLQIAQERSSMRSLVDQVTAALQAHDKEAEVVHVG